MSDNPVTAVILAAGEGRRLEPLTNRRPKPMVPVANRPLLEHVVEAVAAAGIDRIALVVGYRQERIRNHFGDGDDWDVTIEYVEQSTQLGTGHAVLQAEPIVDGPFVVLNGDRIVDADVIAATRERVLDGTYPTMAVTTAERPREYGVVSLDGDSVVAIEEKPEGPVETNRINAGIYGFSPAVFDAIRQTHAPGGAGDNSDSQRPGRRRRPRGDSHPVRRALARRLKLVGPSHRQRGTDRQRNGCGTRQSRPRQLGGRRRRRGGRGQCPRRVERYDWGSTAIGSNATIEANAVVENAVIFPDAVIGAGAVVRDAVVAGNARIGPNATVRQASQRQSSSGTPSTTAWSSAAW